MNRFIDLEELDDTAVAHLLARSHELELNPIGEQLRGRVLGLVFMNPSLRTLASFQAGMGQLGGTSFVINPGQGTWELETRTGAVMDGMAAEHMKEAIPVLCQYADALGLRTFAAGHDLEDDLDEPVLRAATACATKPLINLESAVDHPCQSLADWKTLDDLGVPARGGRLVLSWAWHPKPLPLAVPASVLTMAVRRGMDTTILRPTGFALPPTVLDRARRIAARTGGSVRESEHRSEALDGAHVLYAKSWQSTAFYGRPMEEAALRSTLRSWCVNEEWFAPAERNAVFLHCLPVRRNVVVLDEVLDGPRSRVIQQAGNRLHVQKAILVELLGG